VWLLEKVHHATSAGFNTRHQQATQATCFAACSAAATAAAAAAAGVCVAQMNVFGCEASRA
jgi:hypothetical protein